MNLILNPLTMTARATAALTLHRAGATASVALILWCALPTILLGQNSSLYHRPYNRITPLTPPVAQPLSSQFTPQPTATSGRPGQTNGPPNGQFVGAQNGSTDVAPGPGGANVPGRLPTQNNQVAMPQQMPLLPPNRPGQAPPDFLPYNNPPAGYGDQLGSLQNASWTYAPPATARVLEIHDIISIRVDDAAQTTAQGNASSRKNGIYDFLLRDWIAISGLSAVKPSAQNDGDPRIQGQINEVYRADSTLRTRESMVFNIAAEISDIRPNGNLVLTAQKEIVNNDNIYEMSLSGLCRPQDIGPDNVVLSRDILDLRIAKSDRGHVRDGYSRGWFTRILARFKPF